MLELLFEKIVIDVILPFIAGAVLIGLTLDGRCDRPKTIILWIASFALASIACYLILDSTYGITEVPVLGPIHSKMIQTSTLLCMAVFSAAWLVSALLLHKGTPSSVLVVGMMYSAICIIAFVVNDAIYDLLIDSVQSLPSLWECAAFHLILVAIIFAPLWRYVPGYVRRMVSRTDGRMTRYLPVPTAIFILFALEFGIRIYYSDYTHSNMVGTLIVAGMASLCLYLLISRTGGSIRIEGYKRDLDAAAAIQSSALPNESDMKRLEGLDAHAAMVSSKEVAGDFFSIVRMEGRTGIVVADVSDKGLPAAMFMMRAKTLIDDRLRHGSGPAECLRNVNEALMQDNPTCMFVTALIAVCDGDGHITISSAGHPFPMLRRNGEAPDLAVPRGAMLGLMDSSYGEIELDLLPGDTLLLYTDGATDCEDRNGRQFGIDRLREAFVSSGRDPCGELKDILMGYSSGADIADDVTLVALSRVVGD